MKSPPHEVSEACGLPRVRGLRAVFLAIGGAAGFLVVSGCERGGPPPPKGTDLPSAPNPSAEAPSAALPMTQTKRMEAIKNKFNAMYPPEFFEAERRRRELDTKNYVRAAPNGFEPAFKGKRLKLTLIPGETTLRPGERFRYRAELQNVGSEKVHILEHGGFFKGGGIMKQFGIFVIPPAGKPIRLEPEVTQEPPGGAEIHLPGQERMTEAESDAAMHSYSREAEYQYKLDVYLKPGDTVLAEPLGGADRFYRIFLVRNFEFRPGESYRLKLIYNDDPGPAPSEAEIQKDMAAGRSREQVLHFYKRLASFSHGIIESNTVKIIISK